jgi:hypothetical protein
VTLIQGVSSGERMDSTLRKAVELGVAEVQPVLATRSVARPKGERAEGRRAHWQKVVIAACEQCGRNKVPDVQPLVPVADYRPAAGGAKILLSPASRSPLSKLSFTESQIVATLGRHNRQKAHGLPSSRLGRPSHHSVLLPRRCPSAPASPLRFLGLVPVRWQPQSATGSPS